MKEVDEIFEYLKNITGQKDAIENYSISYKKLRKKASKKGHEAIISLYLSWEEFIVNDITTIEDDPTKEDIRNRITTIIDIEKLERSFRLVFLSERQQLLTMYELAIERLSQYVIKNLGYEAFLKLVKESSDGTVFEEIHYTEDSINFKDLNLLILSKKSEYPVHKMTKTFKGFVSSFYNRIELSLGEKISHGIFQKLYEDFHKTYDSDFAAKLLMITPEKVLGLDEWLSLLSKSELEKQVRDQTKQLNQLNESLEEKVERRTRELQKAYEELRDLDKKKTEFIDVAAHQIRTPVSGIKWVIDMFLQGEVGEITKEQREMLEKAYSANERMLFIVNDLLDTDMITTGKATYQFKEIDLITVIKRTIKELAAQSSARNIEIKLQGAEKAETVGDPEKLQLVIQNLLENAIKYSPKNSQITVDLDVGDRFLIWKIKDEGIGIPENQKNGIFKRFFRATNGIRMQANGSGLGLFIVKNIVKKHNGSIVFDSVENKGTTFTITLPLSQSPVN